VDGLAKASILDIDGVAVPSAIATPAAAYSVRLLGSGVGVPTYTGPAMRVRRDSDNVEADVGFDSNNELSLTSPISNTSDAQSYTDFADFVDHSGTPANGLVRFWYDQSGNSVDIGQSTAGQQPEIYKTATGLVENGSVGNEKPALRFVRSSGHQLTNSGLGCSGKEQNYFYVYESSSSILHSTMVFFNHGSGLTTRTWRLAYDLVISNNLNDYETYKEVNTQRLFSVLSGPSPSIVSDFDVYRNSTLLTPDSASSAGVSDITDTSFQLGGSYTGVNLTQEFIVYNSDESSNRTGIETDIDTYFSIT
jgi:hypothetical protein